MAPGLPLHLLEQQSPSAEQDNPTGVQVEEQEGSEAQSESLQSTIPSQSLSAPSLQLSSLAGGVPQSPGQEQDVSGELQVPSPQNGGGSTVNFATETVFDASTS